jgi:hypothetical protein
MSNLALTQYEFVQRGFTESISFEGRILRVGLRFIVKFIRLVQLHPITEFCYFQDREEALQVIHDVATENMGALCVTEPYRSLKVPLVTSQYEGVQQKADMAAMLLQDLGVSHRSGMQTQNIQT